MKTYYLIILILLSPSCIQKIKYLKGDVEQIPVVNCLFTADSTFKVYIGLTSEIFSDQNTKIENASVKVIANNSDTFFFHQNNDYLFESDSVAKYGVNYKLIVETKNYGIITAESYIPQSPVFDTAFILFDNVYDNTMSYIADQIFVSFFDATPDKDYYEISALIYEENYNQIDSLAVLKTVYAFNTDDFTDVSYEKLNNYPNFLLFNDTFWNTQVINFSVNCILDECNSSDDLIIILKSLSQDYYLYKKSLLIHQNETANSMNMEEFSNMLFVEKNTPIHTNISGGIGIFAGYNNDCRYIISDLQPPFN